MFAIKFVFNNNRLSIRYENDLPPSAFTKRQLSEIRKISLARILCDNGDETDFVQPLAMVSSDIFLNAFQYCNTQIIPKIDLTKWKVKSRIQSPRQSVDKELIRSELVRARREIFEFRETEEKLINMNHLTPTQMMHYSITRAKRQSILLSNNSMLLEKATSGILKHLRSGRDRETGTDISNDIDELVFTLPRIELDEYLRNQFLVHDQLNNDKCDDDLLLPCDHTSPFRTISGLCNNLDNPEFGKSFSLFNRFLPPVYDDGVSIPRHRSVVPNENLPSPRLISTTVHDDVHSPHVRYVSVTYKIEFNSLIIRVSF